MIGPTIRKVGVHGTQAVSPDLRIAPSRCERACSCRSARRLICRAAYYKRNIERKRFDYHSSGKAPTQDASDLAEMIAKSIEGVCAAHNRFGGIREGFGNHHENQDQACGGSSDQPGAHSCRYRPEWYRVVKRYRSEPIGHRESGVPCARDRQFAHRPQPYRRRRPAPAHARHDPLPVLEHR